MTKTANHLCTWDKETLKYESSDYVSEGNKEHKIINFVPIDDGSQGVEHLVSHTNKIFNFHTKEAITTVQKICKLPKMSQRNNVAVGQQTMGIKLKLNSINHQLHCTFWTSCEKLLD